MGQASRPDYAAGHSIGQDLVLPSRPYLLGGTLAAQVPLAGLAKLHFACTGDLEALGDAFVRLLHDELGKRVVYSFFRPFDQAK